MSEDTSNAPAAGCGNAGCGHCGCGGHSARVPELDARVIDRAIRQSAIFGVLMGLPPQGRVTIIAPQDPSPIAEVLSERLPGEYGVEVERVAEEQWRATFSRAAAA